MNRREKSDILEWVYTHDGGYKDKIEWRHAFVEYLETLIEESGDTQAPDLDKPDTQPEWEISNHNRVLCDKKT